MIRHNDEKVFTVSIGVVHCSQTFLARGLMLGHGPVLPWYKKDNLSAGFQNQNAIAAQSVISPF